jgi:hypothetical protein
MLKRRFSSQLITGIVVATALGLGNKPMLAQVADDGSGSNLRSTSPSQQAVTPLPNILYDVVYYRTGSGAETVISIKNTTNSACNVQVEWLLGFGSSQQGVSGPSPIAPQDTLEFTTANQGEAIPPFVLNVFRDTTAELEGSARIRSDCPVRSRFGVNAVLVTGIGSGSTFDYMPISVSRPTGRAGD